MRLPNVLPLLLLVACDSGPSKEESIQIWASASSAMTTGQTFAVDEAGGSGDLALDYSGPCSLGGTITVNGGYSGDGTDMAAFDLTTAFNGCTEITGKLDGSLTWKSEWSGTAFSASIKGDIDWEGQDGSGSCAFDIEMSVSETAVSFGGSLCGYDLKSDLHLSGY